MIKVIQVSDVIHGPFVYSYYRDMTEGAYILLIQCPLLREFCTFIGVGSKLKVGRGGLNPEKNSSLN